MLHMVSTHFLMGLELTYFRTRTQYQRVRREHCEPGIKFLEMTETQN